MVIDTSHSLDLTFHALADPTRRAILARLTEGDASAGELGRPFEISQPAVSKHLRVLERAGFLSRTPQGRVHRLSLMAKPMKEAALWVEHYRKFWETQLDNLADYLEQLPDAGETDTPNNTEK